MKPADAQRLPCHKMKKKEKKTLFLQQQMMSLQCGSRAVLIVDSPSWQGPLGLYTVQWRLVITYES